MTRTLTFRRNFAWNFVGTALYSAAQWALIVLLTHLSNPQVVGRYSLMLAISAPVFLTFGMKLRTAQATDVNGEYRLSEYLSLQAILNVAATLVMLALGIALGLRGEHLASLLLLGVAKSIEANSQNFYGFFQRHERLDLVSRSLLARSLLGPAAFLVGFQLTDSLMGAIAGLALGWWLIQLAIDRHQVRTLHLEILGAPVPRVGFTDTRALRRLARLCFPLGIDSGLSSLTINIPRYALQIIWGATQLALFTTLAYLSQIVSMITFAMSTVLVPRLAIYYHRGQRQPFVQLLILLVGFGAAVSLVAILGAIFLGEPVLRLILDPEYVNPELLAVLMLSAGATTIQRCLCKGLEASRRFSTYMVVDAVTALATLGFAVPLVHAWGPLGAAWALVGGFAAGTVFVLVLLVGVIRDMPPLAK